MRAEIDENKYPKIKTFTDFVSSLDPNYEDDPDAWPCDAEIYKVLKDADVISEYYGEDVNGDYRYTYKALIIWFRTEPEEISIDEVREMYRKAYDEAKRAGITYVEVEVDGDYV